MIQPLNVGNINFYIWNGWNLDLHGNFSIDTSIYAPLTPQLSVSPTQDPWVSGAWMDGKDQLGANRGENFV